MIVKKYILHSKCWNMQSKDDTKNKHLKEREKENNKKIKITKK